jgi:hypothetical protein
MNRLFAFILMLIAAAPTLAADANGYTAMYECRAGGPNCNVDVDSLTKQSCQQTITTADSTSTINSKINGGSQFVCVQAGDYTSKGIITVTASGKAGAIKVLRYSGADSNMPWNQSESNKAKFRRIVFDGADYWIVHRLTFPVNSSFSADGYRISFHNGASDSIFDSNLIEGAPKDSGVSYYAAIGSIDCDNSTNGARMTIQNNVIRTNDGVPGNAGTGIAMGCGTGTPDIRIVNNELYDWSEHIIQIGDNSGPTIPGLIIENNDVYFDAMATESEEPISVKSSGTSGSPQRFIHNRIWGSRYGRNCCIGGGGTSAVVYSVGSNFSYHLWLNNIIFDSGGGIGVVSFGNAVTHQSIIGNIFYQITPQSGDVSALGLGGARAEVYLNTIIDSQHTIADVGADSDVRCNVMIASGPNQQGGVPASYQADYNVFYDTPKFTYNGGNNNIEKGTTTFQAVRGPYTFYRKLRTSPEPYTIPYVRPASSAPEIGACPSNYAVRPGIGINDVN